MTSNIEFGHAEGALGRMAQSVIDAKDKFKKDADKLDVQMKAIQHKWQGDGGRAFQILNTAWNEKHAVVVAALDRFHASLTETEADNVAVDQAASDGLNRLLNKLGGS